MQAYLSLTRERHLGWEECIPSYHRQTRYISKDLATVANQQECNAEVGIHPRGIGSCGVWHRDETDRERPPRAGGHGFSYCSSTGDGGRWKKGQYSEEESENRFLREELGRTLGVSPSSHADHIDTPENLRATSSYFKDELRDNLELQDDSQESNQKVIADKLITTMHHGVFKKQKAGVEFTPEWQESCRMWPPVDEEQPMTCTVRSISMGASVSLISPRTSKRIRRLPPPRKDEWESLEVR